MTDNGLGYAVGGERDVRVRAVAGTHRVESVVLRLEGLLNRTRSSAPASTAFSSREHRLRLIQSCAASEAARWVK